MGPNIRPLGCGKKKIQRGEAQTRCGATGKGGKGEGGTKRNDAALVSSQGKKQSWGLFLVSWLHEGGEKKRGRGRGGSIAIISFHLSTEAGGNHRGRRKRTVEGRSAPIPKKKRRRRKEKGGMRRRPAAPVPRTPEARDGKRGRKGHQREGVPDYFLLSWAVVKEKEKEGGEERKRSTTPTEY